MDARWTRRRSDGGPTRAGTVAAALLPALALVALSFRAGAYFPGAAAFAVVLGLLGVVVVLQLSVRPFLGVGAAALVPIGGMTALALWALLSSNWSGSTARALTESDRYLLYALLVLLGAAAARVPGRLRLAGTGVAAALAVVCGAGVLTRTLPRALPTTPGQNPDRLSFPLSYWNGMGILAAAGVLLCLGVAASRTSSRAVRALAAAAVPMLAVALYLSLARGAIVALGVGLVAFVIVARSREILVAGAVVAAPTALAVVEAYRQAALTSIHPASSAAVSQGRYLLPVVIGCMLAAGLLRLGVEPWEQRLADWRPRRSPSRRTLIAGGAATGLVVVIVAIAAGLPGAIHDGAKRFADAAPVTQGRGRLTSVANNGRIDHWQVALDTFKAHPLKGTGAGTYAVQWAEHRPSSLSVVHAHSAYLGVMSDLGLVGIVLLVGSVLALLAGLARRARGPDRVIVAGAFAAALAWALHAGIDWDLEMPATGAWAFVLGGMALARTAPTALRRPPGATLRLAGGVAVLVVAVTPAMVALSQVRIGRSVDAFAAGDCGRAVDEGVQAANVLGLRPEPYEIVGFCDVRTGQPKLGVTMLRRAVDRDPDWWEYHYGLALVQGAAGEDPRAEAAAAHRLNPRDPLARGLTAALAKATTPAQWRSVALDADLPQT